MAEGRNTNPFTSDDNNVHLPPTVYQPNPFPYSPSEGNPWAPSSDQSYQNTSGQQGHAYSNNTSSTYSYGHNYNNTSSDSGSSFPPYMPMPTPAVPTFNNTNNNSSYNNNYSYDTNAYNNNNTYNNNSSDYNAYSNTNYEDNEDDRAKDEQDNSTADVEEASAVNPGIETHDPDKLKISSQKVTSYNGTPNGWRLLSRFIQFLASAGAFIFIVSATPVTKIPTPGEADKTAIIFLYIVSGVSIIYSFGHLIFYCLRRWNNNNKAPRWALILIDVVLGASFGTLMVFLIKAFSCKPGELQGWCHFYNTSIFFTVLAFVTYAASFIWDIVGCFKG